jgi:hypothetical protein
MTILVQSFLNSATKLSTTATTATTVAQLKTLVNAIEGVSTSIMEFYIKNDATTATALVSGTLGSYGITTATTIYSSNTISTLELGGGGADKETRQKAKLDLAAIKRAADGNLRATYDITQLPTQYNGGDIINNPNAGGLVVGRPWIETVSTFAFYETTGTTAVISTTQYVSGNKIYAESSTYDVPSFQPARVVVNDIEVVDTEMRGHTLVVLNSYGDVVTAATQYDTWDTGGAPGARAALASALGAVASGNIVVLVVYDASGLDAGIRSAINAGYGSTNSDTWVSGRRSHIFIGVKI